MFEIDYIYQKGGPIYKRSYPSLKDKDNNIFVIKGTNDQGKSTILQMIALGLGGQNSDDIDNLLKYKMKRLLSKDIDKCEFTYTIKSSDNVKITSSLQDGNINITVNDKKKSFDYIQDNYKILYDVPDDPIKKLSSSLSLIKDNLIEYQKYSENYLTQIQNNLDKIEDFNKKEQRLIQEKKDLKDRISSFNQYNDRFTIVEKNYKKLSKSNFIIAYDKLIIEYNFNEKQLADLVIKIQKLESAGIGGGNKEYRSNIRHLIKILQDLKTSTNININDYIKYLNKDEIDICKSCLLEIKNSQTINDLSNDKIYKWSEFFSNIQIKFANNPIYCQKSPEEEERELYKNLVVTLKKFLKINIKIPGTNGKTITEFISDLEYSINELDKKLVNKYELESIVEINKVIIDNIKSLDIIRKSIPEIKNETEEYDGLVERRTSLQKYIKSLETQIARDHTEYNNIPEDEKKYVHSFSEIDLKQKYKEVSDEYKELSNKIIKLNSDIQNKNKLIKDLENIQKPLNLDKDSLKIEYDIVGKLLHKISSWIDKIEKIDISRMTVEDKDISNEFYAALSEYFANVLKVIYFENKSWPVVKVDIVNRRYEVEGRKPIDFVDIGTGHNQLNSLLAKLKQNYAGRKKIVLFDEIGVMDDNNVNRLIKEIKIQVKSGDVIFALLTRVDKNNNVIMEPIT